MRLCLRWLLALASLCSLSPRARGEPPAPDLLRELHWRAIGPLRGGRTKAVAGVPQRRGVFYLGAVNGGVFRTDDFGRTWTPIFDDQPTGSIGAIAVAPSDPDVVYVGSGEGLHRPDLSTGDGFYRSLDAGAHWQHLGLRGAQQISQIAVDPHDASRLFVAALGHPYGPSDERGIFRSLDGGEHFERVLHQGPDAGGADVAIDPSNPAIVYASLWEAREGPWENGEFRGPGSGFFKSQDGGSTWKRLGKGLPTFEAEGLSRIAFALAPSLPSRLFAAVTAKKNGGLYRSDDAGESWHKASADERGTDREDLGEVRVHPTNPDIVFTNSEVVWKSIDSGKTFTALRGAPGGDDYLHVWINPADPEVMIIGSDQGAIITVNGGRTFSSWFNQNTGQMFHVTADNSFPYRVCGGQQDSGSACVSSRGPEGQITARDWHPAWFEEYGYAAPDPLDPDIIYGGRISRGDRRTGQVQDISPEPIKGPDYRIIRTQPVVFSPLDPHLLYFASNRVYSTRDGGDHWTILSGDLTRKEWAAPANVGKYRGSEEAKATRRGVVYALAPSPVAKGVLWAGTDDGLIHLTRDGGAHWTDVTPPQLSAWAKVSVIEASHTEAETAYAAINTLRLDDLNPHLLRTRDGGKSWVEITQGLPGGAPTNVVREDPVQKGLLFAGSELAVHFSLDDGDHWQPLRLNMPATSIRDLIVKNDDLVVATHGRGFFILDDITPLRQWQDKVLAADAHLFAPQVALRVRWNTNTDTPPPPDEPAGENPPEGALINYHLRAASNEPVVIEILDDQGKLVRRYSSADKLEPLRDEGNVPRYWIRPAQRVSAAPGLHRLVWDLHYPAPAAAEFGYPIAAVKGNTPREPRGPWAVPGKYQVRLIAAGTTYQQPLEVRLDPRLKTPVADLALQLEVSSQVVAAMAEVQAALLELRELRAKEGKSPHSSPDFAQRLAALDAPAEEPPRRRGPKPEALTLPAMSARLTQVLGLLQESDVAPRPPLAAAAEASLREATSLVERWRALRAEASAPAK